jgi:hypothetical protein
MKGLNMKLLNEIQQKLSVPKNRRNNFGNYNYRSCEDILNAVKPFLGEATLKLSDCLETHGGRVFVISRVNLQLGEEIAMVEGCAEVPVNRKGMDASQITGCASSYARKYALNGLFCIDDVKDADSDEHNTNSNSPSGQGEW